MTWLALLVGFIAGVLVLGLAWHSATRNPSAPEPEPQLFPRTARSVELVKLPHGGHDLFIDGKSFGYFVEKTGPSVDLDLSHPEHDMWVINIPLIVDTYDWKVSTS